MSKFQKLRQRRRLRAVDNVVATIESALAKKGETVKAVERWRAEMPTEAEMLPKDKYTIFDRKEKRYRKGIHSMHNQRDPALQVSATKANMTFLLQSFPSGPVSPRESTLLVTKTFDPVDNGRDCASMYITCNITQRNGIDGVGDTGNRTVCLEQRRGCLLSRLVRRLTDLRWFRPLWTLLLAPCSDVNAERSANTARQAPHKNV